MRPHLEHCLSVWLPYLRKDNECLEKVKRRETKLVKGLSSKSYEKRLSLLGIISESSESQCKCLTCNQKPIGSQFSLLHEPNYKVNGKN